MRNDSWIAGASQRHRRDESRRASARGIRRAVAALPFAVLLAAALAGVPSTSAVPGPPEVTARAAIVVDDATGDVLYEKNAYMLLPPASLTKIVTAIVVLERCYLNEPVRVRADWDELPDSSVMGIVWGDILTVEELLYGLLLPSGNDAALALARRVAGNESAFVTMMNRRVRQLGLIGSYFRNSHGLHESSHYTTAYDIATLARYALRNPTFAKIVATPRTTVRGYGVYPLRNTNWLLRTYEGSVGVKTGYTDEALMTLVGAAEQGGRRLVVAVLGSQNSFQDGQRLLDYGFDNSRVLLAGTRAADGSREPPLGRARVFGPWYTPDWPPWWGHVTGRRAFEIEFALFLRTSRAWHPG